jgi:hypothetical protein
LIDRYVHLGSSKENVLVLVIGRGEESVYLNWGLLRRELCREEGGKQIFRRQKIEVLKDLQTWVGV